MSLAVGAARVQPATRRGERGDLRISVAPRMLRWLLECGPQVASVPEIARTLGCGDRAVQWAVRDLEATGLVATSSGYSDGRLEYRPLVTRAV